MTIKIKIRVGEVEIDYEGSEDFFKAEWPSLLNQVSDLQRISTASNGNSESVEERQDGYKDTTSGNALEMTTNNIASQLGVNVGADLAMAACAHLAFAHNKDTFSREEILQDMKSASNYYKANHSSNLSQMLKKLVDQKKLIERSSNVFALQAEQKQDLEKKLAG